jgi:hypothetical protein
MVMGQAYSDLLTPREQEALQAGCDLLIDTLFSELGNVKNPQDVMQTTVVGYLPERYLYKYSPQFLRKFAVCIVTVAWKLAQLKHVPLSSVAEELAAWVIIHEAKAFLELNEDAEAEEGEDAFDAFIEGYFEDTDFLFLYSNAHDGIDETQVGQMLGMSSLAFDDWFGSLSTVV